MAWDTHISAFIWTKTDFYYFLILQTGIESGSAAGLLWGCLLSGDLSVLAFLYYRLKRNMFAEVNISTPEEQEAVALVGSCKLTTG